MIAPVFFLHIQQMRITCLIDDIFPSRRRQGLKVVDDWIMYRQGFLKSVGSIPEVGLLEQLLGASNMQLILLAVVSLVTRKCKYVHVY